ncbi:MAG: hypothetical protein JW904_12190 [Spirochaetales bacterium]|nr:hypothetical protein [Spirochaetales bacterium]
MEETELFKLLEQKEMPFVLIGGTALSVYGSLRVTIDTDIAIRTLDVDHIIAVFYECGYKMVTSVDKNQFPVFTDTAQTAIRFAEKNNWGFLKFIGHALEFDALYDIPIPFAQLYKDAEIRTIEDINIRIASLKHLKIMKEKSLLTRDDPEKKKMDELDLKFIRTLMQ